jgi:hypothetical protein
MKYKHLILTIFTFTILMLMLILTTSQAISIKAEHNGNKISKTVKDNNTEKTKDRIDIQTTKPFKATELAKFIPNSILGKKATPPSSGTRHEGKIPITTASKDYQLTKKCFLTITFTDYGTLKNIPDNEMSDYKSLPQENGKTSSKFEIRGGRGGFKLWSDQFYEGSIAFLYYDRFAIRLDILKWDKSLSKFDDFVKLIDLKKLVLTSEKSIKH